MYQSTNDNSMPVMANRKFEYAPTAMLYTNLEIYTTCRDKVKLHFTIQWEELSLVELLHIQLIINN